MKKKTLTKKNRLPKGVLCYEKICGNCSFFGKKESVEWCLYHNWSTNRYNPDCGHWN